MASPKLTFTLSANDDVSKNIAKARKSFDDLKNSEGIFYT